MNVTVSSKHEPRIWSGHVWWEMMVNFELWASRHLIFIGPSKHRLDHSLARSPRPISQCAMCSLRSSCQGTCSLQYSAGGQDGSSTFRVLKLATLLRTCPPLYRTHDCASLTEQQKSPLPFVRWKPSQLVNQRAEVQGRPAVIPHMTSFP